MNIVKLAEKNMITVADNTLTKNDIQGLKDVYEQIERFLSGYLLQVNKIKMLKCNSKSKILNPRVRISSLKQQTLNFQLNPLFEYVIRVLVTVPGRIRPGFDG